MTNDQEQPATELPETLDVTEADIRRGLRGIGLSAREAARGATRLRYIALGLSPDGTRPPSEADAIARAAAKRERKASRTRAA